MLLLLAALVAAPAAAAARPTVYVLPTGTVDAVAQPRALGLMVAGAGGSISRAGAIASLRRGKVENALLGGKPSGDVLVDVDFGLAPPDAGKPIVYVELPPPGRHPNTMRYPVAFVGGGYHGILTSTSTRIRGLLSIADIAPSLVALDAGRRPRVRSEADANPLQGLNTLDRRLTDVHRDRGWALTAVVLTILALSVTAPRAAAAAGAAAVGAALLLSWWEATRLWVVALALVAFTAVVAFVASLRWRVVVAGVGIFFVAYLLVLTLAPEVNSLAVLGARPDGGGRFYGITNQVETLLLPATLVAAAALALPWLVAFALLALVTVGWSRAGADGGGLIVYAIAFALLALRLRDVPITRRRLVVTGAAIVLLVLAFVGIDAALGGSSHVTDAFGSGPRSLLGDWGRRLHLSWAMATAYWRRVFTFLACLAVLVWIATRRPRHATVDTMLVAVAISLLVNDTPVDVIGLGALGCWVLWRLESLDSQPVRRGLLGIGCAVGVLALAGCGGKGVKSPLPQNVVGTVAKEAPGKAIFASQGCEACHTYAPANATGTIGPDLDKLAQYAQRAKQPLAAFTHESIVKPSAYVEKGYPDAMPKDYGQKLSDKQLSDLVDFLAKPQG